MKDSTAFPKSITFQPITNWDNLSVSNFNTLIRLNRFLFKKNPSICCPSKYEGWVRNIDTTPQLKEAFKKAYDSIVELHTRYTIKWNGIKNISKLGFVNSDFITEEQIKTLMALYGDKYVELNETADTEPVVDLNETSKNEDIQVNNPVGEKISPKIGGKSPKKSATGKKSSKKR